MVRVMALTILLVPTELFGQELIPSPGFDSLQTCLFGPGGVHPSVSIGWGTAAGSPDAFNACCIDPLFHVPQNTFGWQQPASGDTYAGFYVEPGISELIRCTLLQPLQPGLPVDVCFKVSLAGPDQGIYDAGGLATNKIGVRFSHMDSDNFYIQAYPLLNYGAHIWTDSVVTDTLGWTTIEGTFMPDSAYCCMLLGVLHPPSQVTTVLVDPNAYPAGYYFVDDVHVVQGGGGSVCNPGMDASERALDRFAVSWSEGRLVLTGLSKDGPMRYLLRDTQGRVLQKGDSVLAQGRTEITCSSMPSGIQVLTVMQAEEEMHVRFFVP